MDKKVVQEQVYGIVVKAVIIQAVVVIASSLVTWFTVSLTLPAKVSAIEADVRQIEKSYETDMREVRQDIKRILEKL